MTKEYKYCDFNLLNLLVWPCAILINLFNVGKLVFGDLPKHYFSLSLLVFLIAVYFFTKKICWLNYSRSFKFTTKKLIIDRFRFTEEILMEDIVKLDETLDKFELIDKNGKSINLPVQRLRKKEMMECMHYVKSILPENAIIVP